MDEAIRAEGLVKQFGATRALDGIDLSVPRGTVLGLLGPNGAGKTTAVRILATLLAPDAGQAWVDGCDVASEAAAVRSRIGLTGQYASVDEKLTGRENLILIARLLGFSRRDARARAGELLVEFGLEDAAHRPVQTYSGGMRRRLDLAASLVGRPRILFLDEPTTGLDPRARLDLWNLIRELVAQGTTVLLTTQYLEEADSLADEIVVIDQGRVIASGTSDQLKARIGGQTLVLAPEHESDVATALSIVTEIVGREPEVDGARLRVPVSDPALVPAVVRRLDESGIVARELTLRGASLDDVFLTLTGRHASVETPAGDAEAAP
ncbi:MULTISPECIES: ATP-binding cassette domain-containing protein [Halomonadaceae]|uniref:ATP-binding cassette domain-containing protein n=1 Tax=Vreelandella halophila TaxID=86177 RepID=A0A9X4YDM6_9GAMM|nr:MULTISPECIES: ATP-binding cassette domain-containing protein [Halomonas]MYL27218.1 ATP-binding cassette domain-containing protein [Halomonas utahensis]MYL74420.1 ATP-binding cassette domain-containing protein [Halomonas sp. 22501_18_FS]